MSEPTQRNIALPVALIALAATVAFLYAPVLAKLGRDWWTDENYSHGLLVPFVIGSIIWGLRDRIGPRTSGRRGRATALIGILLALLMLVAGTLGAELFTQRISLVVMLASIVIFLWGRGAAGILAVPFALLLLAVPIPQILFNRIALPLQAYASQLAVWGIRLFGVPTVRKGNVIDILPDGGIQTISLEVVEACSGIRSLMTLVTLAVILGYFTRSTDTGRFANMPRIDIVRTAILMVAAVPIAVITNAARVTSTGVLTFYYGKQATAPALHEASGWLVYVVALGLLISFNYGLKRLFSGDRISDPDWSASVRRVDPADQHRALTARMLWPLLTFLVVAGIGVNWIANRTEVTPARLQLTTLSTELGEWRQRGKESKFDPNIEQILRATDYTMREYTGPGGHIANIYVGYYSTQRTGSTYHSPQNCLPGAGWVMSDPEVVTITTPEGRSFTANRYLLENGIYREVMLYWYQGRGRTESSEYRDKLNTILDSVSRRRTDGAMVRVMTNIVGDESAAEIAVADLAARLEDQLPLYVPE